MEVTGLKAENLELKEKVAALEDVVAGLTVEVEKVAALEEAVAGLTVEVAGSKQAGKPIYDK